METHSTWFKNKTLFASVLLMLVFIPLPGMAAVESDPSIPVIFPRSYWGANEALTTWQTEYAKVQKIIVHHTASTKLAEDADGSGEYKSMVDAIYRYHTSSKSWTDGEGASYNGFGDIGYNYLIDPEGNIYEGRKGGNGVVGGHASGFNTGSVGISIIGNYQSGAVGQTNAELDPKVEKALSKLVGWIAANNGINLDASSNFCGKTIDGLVGHRDVAATQCPGSVLYSELSSVQADADAYEDAYKNNVYQVQGSSGYYIIAGGYKTKFSSRSDMPAAFQSRAVKYISKTQLEAYQYKDMTILPDGTLIQENGAGTVYYIEGGKKRPLGMDEAGFLKVGFKAADVVSVSSTELDYYEMGAIIKYGPDGTLIKDSGNTVYYVENGKKRRFTSATLFTRLGYSWSKVKADGETAAYLDGDVMRYANGTLLRANGASGVYLVENGSRRLFTSGALFERLGYRWTDILAVDSQELNLYPSGANMLYPNGVLLRGAGTPTVYLIDNGQKREITSATLLYKLGFNFSNVIEVPQPHLADYATGAKAAYPDGTLIKAVGSPAVYRVQGGTKQEFTSLCVFNAAGARWSNVIEISAGEMGLYATNGFVKYPENSLLRAEGGDKIYVIKAGQAVWIQTAEEFVKAGYKWSNVMVIAPTELDLYVPTISGNTGSSSGDGSGSSSDGSDGAVTTGTEPDIRIALTSSTGESVKITANGSYKVEYRHADGGVYQSAQKSGGEVTETQFFSGTDYVRFVPASDSVIMQVVSYEDTHPLWNGKTNDNEFRGTIELKYSNVSNKLWVIEEVPLEGYLKGIAEASSSSPSEYLKAFSVITRTYAMYYIQRGGKHAGEPFHLKNSRNGNGNDQQYKGYNLEMRSSKTAASYGATMGQVIEYNNSPIVAAYSSDSGGVTKSGCEALSANYCASAFDYLDGGVQDPEATVHDPAKVAISHGAGMSAVGAYQMAVEGKSWQDIITHYYLGVGIDKYY